MNKSNLKIAVIGAGAIGGPSAAFMKQAGWDPILVCKDPKTLAQVKKTGIRIAGIKGPFQEVVRFRNSNATLSSAPSALNTAGSSLPAFSRWSAAGPRR